ncbi:MAG: hypothetical protein Q9M25_07150 [Mariprofundaceae bacterium]|nr:hypothetical protein [Mariprofundaceae bacterium]
MTAKVQTLPGALPLHENRDFLRESEWIILKLLCRPLDDLAKSHAEELSAASGGQLSVERCAELIAIVRVSQLPGLGSWAARLLVEAGLSKHDVCSLSAEDVCERVNQHTGYAIFNSATTRALAELQQTWSQETRQEGT